VFILWAIPIGVLVGLALGGRLEGLAGMRIRLAPLAVAGLLVQVALYSPLGAGLPDDVGRIVYVASTLAVAATLLANLSIPGVALVVLGAASNLAAILANGGAMPANAGALRAAGVELDGPSNSVVVAHPALEPLTDVFALPRELPLANVFSVGDVLIAVGIAVAIAASMRAARPHPSRA
jgi:hypothetical protein